MPFLEGRLASLVRRRQRPPGNLKAARGLGYCRRAVRKRRSNASGMLTVSCISGNPT